MNLVLTCHEFVVAILYFNLCATAWLISCRIIAIIALILQVIGVILVIILLIWVLCEAMRGCDDEAGWCDRCIIYLTPIIWILAGMLCADYFFNKRQYSCFDSVNMEIVRQISHGNIPFLCLIK